MGYISAICLFLLKFSRFRKRYYIILLTIYLTMKVLAILACIALSIGLVSADICATKEENGTKYYKCTGTFGDCMAIEANGEYHSTCNVSSAGFTSDAKCMTKGGLTKCYQVTSTGGKWECSSKNWGKGDGSVKDGGCCKTDDDCKDSCNGVICGKSW
jgi:hypothetical protein